MKYYLTYQDLNYILIYKHKKNISIRVKEGIIEVSAPYNTSLQYIEQLLEDYKERLMDQINNYSPYYELKDQGYIYIFDTKYIINYIYDHKNQCLIKDNIIYVYGKDLNKSLSVYTHQLLYNYIIERMIKYLSYDFDLDMPEVVIKKYKSKWGSCYYKENRISFNISLIHIEKELIDYVIIHELCHFLVHNHSVLFYNEVEKRLPEYKRLIKSLKEKHV